MTAHWETHAACRQPGTDPALFFPDGRETPIDRARRIRNAQTLCNTCPVQRRCLDEAETRNEPWGIWGGKDFTPTRGEEMGEVA